VVTLVGQLDLAAAPKGQRALLKHLAEQPDAVICDLARWRGSIRCAPASSPPSRTAQELAAAWVHRQDGVALALQIGGIRWPPY
jgi:hypothetical protein